MPQDTELHKVTKDGDVAATQDLLGTGAAVNALGAQGRTALHRALGGGFAECARVLLDARQVGLFQFKEYGGTRDTDYI